VIYVDDSGKRRRRGFFDDFMDDDFFGGDPFRSRIFENMSRFMRDAMADFDRINAEPGKSFVYGFNMHTGPDGKPIIEEFGNVPRQGIEHLPGEREPLVDIIENAQGISVIAELPGVGKEDINLSTDGKSLSIKVDASGRKYFKDLRMPSEVDPDSIKATYKNGILEVKLKPKGKKNREEKRINID
jgi:HSP20 family protein